MKVRPYLFLVGGLILGIGIAMSMFAANNSQPVVPEIGKPLAEFELYNLTGEKIKLAQFRGQPLVINFWATWCLPCKDEMPFLNTVYQKYNDRLVVVGIDSQEKSDTVSEFISQNKIDFPILLDPDNQTIRNYLIRGFPTTFFVDGRGILTAMHIGGLDDKTLADYLRQMGVAQ